jgi:4-hydroxy-4-methyl-2-oxoglutarate aldolase
MELKIKFLKMERNIMKSEQIQYYIKELRSFSTTELSDALAGRGVMETSIKPIDLTMKIAGVALTVKLPFQESQRTWDAIRQAGQYDVIVIDTSKTVSTAAWGDMKTEFALKQGIEGVVIDGAIRDLNRNLRLNLPMFAKYVTPSASGKKDVGEINVSITCGGVEVSPGDYVLGDENGVVVIPEEQIENVLERAREKLAKDEATIKKIKDGLF